MCTKLFPASANLFQSGASGTGLLHTASQYIPATLRHFHAARGTSTSRMESDPRENVVRWLWRISLPATVPRKVTQSYHSWHGSSATTSSIASVRQNASNRMNMHDRAYFSGPDAIVTAVRPHSRWAWQRNNRLTQSWQILCSGFPGQLLVGPVRGQ